MKAKQECFLHWLSERKGIIAKCHMLYKWRERAIEKLKLTNSSFQRKSLKNSFLLFAFMFDHLKTLYFHLLYLDVWSSFVKFCVWCDITEFILLLMAIQLFQHSFLKRLSFLHWITMASLLKSTNYIMCGSILGIFYSSELCYVLIAIASYWVLESVV